MAAANASLSMEALYGAHGSWLQTWLARRTRCHHRAADLAQDTFCRLLESPAIASIREPRSYLATVARRLLIDDIRRRDIERAVNEAVALRQSDIDSISPDRIAEAVGLLDAVVRILDGLPAETRRAFLLRRIDGLEQQEIAQRLGISLSTVKRHIAAAYARCYAVAYAE